METDISTALATLQLDPDNAHALGALKGVRPGNGSGVDPATLARALADSRRWHRERGDFQLCIQLLDLELPWTTDPARRADLLHEKGRILADELLSEAAAQACFREALENVPDHAPSMEGLTQMALIGANWRAISARYLAQAEAAPDRQLAASLFVSIAEMFLKYEPTGAEGETYLRKSLELDPRNRRASLQLERLLRGRNRPEELLGLLAERATQAQSREEKAAAEVASAELSLELGKNDEALVHFRRALEANPAEPKALRPVVAALTERRDWPELARMLDAAARSKRGETDTLLLTQLATLQWKKLGQPAQAEINFRKVRKFDPANRPMVEFYRELYARPEDLPQLLAVLTAAQKAEPDVERRVSMGIEMARAAEARPQNAEKVIDIWKGLLRLRPHLPEAVQALRRLYVKTQKWNALLDLLKEDLEALPESARDERIERHLEIAEIYRDRLSLDVMVVNTYLSVLQIDPRHAPSLVALAHRFEAQGRWNDLIQILGRQAELSTDPQERLRIHRRIAGLWADKLGKHQNAVSSLEKILEADPGDAETRARLRDLYGRSRSWRALVELTRREAPLLAAPERRQRLAEAARISSERLGDVKESVNLWNQVLTVDPRDSEGLGSLATLYDRERRWAALAEILERQRELVTKDPAAEAALLERRGVLLFEKLGAVDAAIAVFRRVQALQPQNPRATRALREVYAQSGDFEALERLYAEQGNFEELCDALSMLADRTKDAGARARMLERVAVLASEKLRQPERSMKAYERILTADPGHLGAAEALVPLYRASQKWPRLLAIYETLLGRKDASQEDPATRLAILEDARQIAEQRMGSKGLAFQWAARCFEAAPSDEATQSDLERLAGDAEEWDQVVALYTTQLAAPIPKGERHALLRRLLRIATSRLSRPAEARGFAEALLKELPGDPEAQSVLEQLLTQAQAWPALTALLAERAHRTEDAAERGKQLFRIAQIEEERSGDGEAAARTLREIVALDGHSELAHRALRSLARILEQRQDWPGLITALRRELDLRPAEDHDDILLRIAEIEERKVGDLGAAFGTLETILASNPYSQVAVAGLERLREAGFPRKVEIATLSLPLYERSDNPARLAGALEVLVAGGAPAERAERLQRLVALYGGPLGDPRAAYRCALLIFDAAPGDRGNRELLTRFAGEVGQPEVVADLAAHLRGVASTVEDQVLRRDLLVEVAELHEARLGNAADAEKVYREILEVEPLHLGAFRALSRMFRDGERWRELRDLLEARETLLREPSARLELAAQIAEIDETVLDDGDHAIATYERMLELDPADPRAYKALDRHYAARERWREREQLLERRLRFAPEGEVSELEMRRAESRFERFGDVDGAIDILASIVKTKPGHAGARRLLEKALTLPEHRLRAAQVLEPLYEAAGAFKPLALVLEVQTQSQGLSSSGATAGLGVGAGIGAAGVASSSSVGADGRSATTLLARLAGIYETRLDDPGQAFATWRRVLAIDSGHGQALTEVERLGAKLQRWSDLVDVYQEIAFRRDGSDLAGRAELLARAARLHSERLGNRRAAIEAWKLVLSLDPENLVTTRPALEALETLYVETNNTSALIKVLRQRAEWAEPLAARSALLFRIADLEENGIADLEAAVATLRSVLDLDPSNALALDDLERIFEKSGQARAQIEILRRRIDLSTDPAVRRGIWRRIAEIFERQVGDLNEAISANLAILDESPEDVGALDALAELYGRQERHAARLEVLERRLSLSPAGPGANRQDQSDSVPTLRRIAELLSGPLASPADALGRWRELLALAPSDPGALGALEHLLGGEVDPSLRLGAAQALESTYEAAGRFAELGAVLRIYVEAEEDPRARIPIWERLARLEEHRLEDSHAAFEAYGAAIRDALAEPQLGGLLDAYERLASPERVPQVIALYREISPDLLDDVLKQRLDRWIAEGALRAGDTALAADSYRRVLDRAPDDLPAMEALERIYADGADDDRLYEILERRGTLAAGTPAERKRLAQLGQLAEKMGRREDAVAAYERVFELHREDREAIEALDRIYLGSQRWSDLVSLLDRQLERRMPEASAIEIRFRLAEIQMRQMGNVESALGHLGAVLRGDPDHPGAIGALETLLGDPAAQGTAAELLEPVYAGRQDWAALIRVGEIRLQGVEEMPQRLALTKRIARLYEEQLDDYDSALRWYGRVFHENPSDRQNLEQLLRLAGKLNHWQEVGAQLSDYLASALDETPAVLDIVRRAAEIFDLKLGNRTEARLLYRRLFQARPEDPEVAALFEGALERWGEWVELRELLDEEAARAGDLGHRVRLLRRSAQLDEERLDDIDRALVTLREILAITSDHPAASGPEALAEPGAADEIERLLRGQARWHDLADHLELEIARAADVRGRDAITLRLADVLEARTENAAGAVDRYAEILERSPTHREAIAALERLMGDPILRARVASVLEPVYRQSQNWARLAAVLEAELESVDDRRDRVRLLREVADIQQRLAHVDSAFETRARAWLVDVSNADTLGELEGLALSAKLYGPYVETLQEGAALAGEPDLEARLWAASAQVLEHQLRDPGQAVDAWREALRARPDDTDSFVALERLLAEGKRTAELVEVLEQHLEVLSSPAERKEIAKRIANLEDHTLKQRERAIDAWRTVLEIDDADLDALDALGRLYIGGGAWRDLAAVLQRKIELTPDLANLRLMRLTAARLYEEKLGEAQEAVGQLRAVLDVFPEDIEALVQLDRILSHEGQHAELLEVLDLRAAVEAEAAVRDQIAVRAARLLADQLSDVEGALARYRQVLERSPGNVEAEEEVWKIARGEDYRRTAVSVLEPVLRAEARWSQVVEVLELRLVTEDASTARVATLTEIAEIEELYRLNLESAFAAWSRAFAEDPLEMPPRQALERLASATGDWAALARVYDEALGSAFDGGLQRTLAMRLGEISEGAGGDLEAALGYYRKAADTPGDETPVLSALERVLTVLRRPAELADVLARRAEATPIPGQQAELLVRLGRIRVTELDDVDGGLGAFREALEKEPDSESARIALRALLELPAAREGALDVLEPLAEARGDYADLADLYEHRLSTRDDPAERAARLRQIAELYQEHLNQPERALAALGRALQDEPAPGETVDALERVGAALGKPAATAALIEAAIAKADAAAGRELSLRAARLYESDPGATPVQHEAARLLYLRVLDEDGENLDALAALETLYRRRPDPRALASVLERRSEHEFDPAARHARLMEAADLYVGLGDSAAALAALGRLREAEEGNAEVLDRMAALLEAGQRPAELVDVLGERARFENAPALRSTLLGRIGVLKASALDDLDGAADAFREALDGRPGDLGLLAAWEAIEEKREDWSTLQEVLLRRLGSSEETEQIPVLFHLARNAELHLSDVDQAVGFLHQILGIDPTNGMAFLELERLLRDHERWYDLVDVLGKHADAEGEAGRRPTELALRVATATVWEKNLDAPDSAVEALERVLDLAPNHVGALLALARIHEATQRWDDATAMLQRAAAQKSVGPEAAEIHYRTAQIRRAQGADEAELEAIYIRALEADRGHVPSLRALEAAGRAKGDVARVLQVLELRLEVTPDPTERRPLLADIVKLQRDRQGDRAASIPFLRQLVALGPADLGVSEELADALTATGETDEATAILQRVVDQLGPAKRNKDVARIQQRLGAIAERKGDRAAALERYGAAYKLDPGHPGTLAALGRLAMAGRDVDGARRYFRSLLLQTFDEKAAGITKGGVYLALGQIHVMAAELPKARNMFERGLETDPNNPELKQALAALPR
jgi:tetratricopeptide (TPR) repeat protein